MERLKAAVYALAGGIAGAALATTLHTHSQPAVVHAQDQFTTIGGCVSAVPKSWGHFVGASTYGLAFEDEQGTVRFIQHPVCGNALSISSAPSATVDQEIVRR
jgi:hypothetical protein